MVFIGYKLYKPTTIGFSDGNKYDVVIWCDVIIGAIVVFIGYKPTTVGIWWWSGCLEHDWIMTFHSVENVIIPTDELIFFRGVVLPPTRFLIFWHTSKIQYPSFYVEYQLLGYWVIGHLQFLGWFSSQAGKLLWNLWVPDNLEPQKHDHHCFIEASWVLVYSHGNSQFLDMTSSTSCLWKHTSQRPQLPWLLRVPSWSTWTDPLGMCNETHLGLTKRLEESEERVFSEFFVAVEVRPLQWRTFQLILQPDLLRVRSMVGAKKR